MMIGVHTFEKPKLWKQAWNLDQNVNNLMFNAPIVRNILPYLDNLTLAISQ
jgi:hypothetical protein